MYKTTLLDYYGSVAKAADALNCSRQCIYLWGDIIPELWAWKVEGKTRGKLKCNELLYEEQAA
jgi:hypothetical protein